MTHEEMDIWKNKVDHWYEEQDKWAKRAFQWLFIAVIGIPLAFLLGFFLGRG